MIRFPLEGVIRKSKSNAIKHSIKYVDFRHLSFETNLSFEIHETGPFSRKVIFYRSHYIKQLEMSLESQSFRHITDFSYKSIRLFFLSNCFRSMDFFHHTAIPE